VFVESDAGAARVIKANIANFDAQAEVLVMSVAALGTAAQPVDLVMLDPPYGQGLGEPALARLMAQGWLGPATLVSVETQRGEALEADGFVVLADRNYGKARLRLLQPG
jgi:16S rRNA (guanine966-N2)-methyltransferase